MESGAGARDCALQWDGRPAAVMLTMMNCLETRARACDARYLAVCRKLTLIRLDGRARANTWTRTRQQCSAQASPLYLHNGKRARSHYRLAVAAAAAAAATRHKSSCACSHYSLGLGRLDGAARAGRKWSPLVQIHIELVITCIV